MAKYRQLHTDFWNDGFVLDLTPEEKYFYIYLMTNPNTTQCGIYELPKRIIETQTGYNRETVDKLLERFHDYGKISYCEETKEIMVENWIKYNQPNNLNAIKCVNRELGNVKNKEFILMFYKQCISQQLNVEGIFNKIELIDNNPIIRGYEGAYNDLVSKEVINNKEEVISNKEEVKVISKEGEIQESTSATVGDVLVFFEKNICKPKEMERDKLISWATSISCDVIILAIAEAVEYNAKNIKYIESILNSWIKKGLKTSAEVLQYKKLWEKVNKKTGICALPTERVYDFKELERKLLGWDMQDG